MDQHSARLSALRRSVRVDLLYVSALPNIRYLTGFSGSAGHLLVEPDRATLFTDARYRVQASAQTDGIALEISEGDARFAFAAALRNRAPRILGFESNRLSYAAYSYLGQELPRCKLVPVDSGVERLRARKSPAEIEAIRNSVLLNSRAFDQACAFMRPGWTEARLAAEIEFRMRRLGAEGASFPTIVAAGAQGALPHAEPGDRVVEPGRPVVVDQGATLCGYCSDMTRMVALGHPDEADGTLIQAVLEAHEAAVDAIRDGVECRTVDRAARLALKSRSVDGVRLDTLFTHSTGHGLGLEIHERPRIGPKVRQRLRSGMVVTVEPGVYLPGRVGVRIEDVVAVTESGCDVLTRTPRALRVLEGPESIKDAAEQRGS